MDGLRKVPDNLPNQDMVAEHLGRPLTAIPDPFGTHDSYGAHMNARLQAFLDEFGFAYTFKSGTDEYRSGRFNATLLKVLERHERSARWCCRRWGRTGARPTARSCRSRPGAAACCRCRSRNAGPTKAPSCFAMRMAR